VTIVDQIYTALQQFIPFTNLEIFWIIAVSIPGLIIFLTMSVNALVAVYFENKVSAFMQDRLGPMEVGIFGFTGGKKFWGGIGQTLADAIKLLAKEDILPVNADRRLMIFSPFFIFLAPFLTFIGLPLYEGIVVSNFSIGILYILAVSSIGVIGIILAGWSSNNKWSLYGAMRSAAQIISYEIPVALSIMAVILVVGSLKINDIVLWQEENRWFIFHSPFMFIAAIIFFISVVAETNRTPFDISEAESELVAGWMTEFSGFRWALFFLSEYASMLIVSLVASIVFLGGWLSPLEMIDVPFFELPLIITDVLTNSITGPIWLLIKAAFLIFVMMWFRWTFPRLRVDQLMYLCWKVFIPISLLIVVFVSIWELIFN